MKAIRINAEGEVAYTNVDLEMLRGSKTILLNYPGWPTYELIYNVPYDQGSQGINFLASQLFPPVPGLDDTVISGTVFIISSTEDPNTGDIQYIDPQIRDIYSLFAEIYKVCEPCERNPCSIL